MDIVPVTRQKIRDEPHGGTPGNEALGLQPGIAPMDGDANIPRALGHLLGLTRNLAPIGLLRLLDGVAYRTFGPGCSEALQGQKRRVVLQVRAAWRMLLK